MEFWFHPEAKSVEDHAPIHWCWDLAWLALTETGFISAGNFKTSDFLLVNWKALTLSISPKKIVSHPAESRI